MPTSGPVHVRKEGEVATVVMERPPLNILNLAMMEDLTAAFERLVGAPDVGVAVLESSVKGVFSAGADVKEHLPPTAETLLATMERLLVRVMGFPHPTVAVVRGRCLGGGMELAMGCDFVLASDSATFGQPEVSLGVFPPIGAGLYPRLVGLRHAYDVILTGRTLSAAEAASMGFVTSVHPEAELDAAMRDLIAGITAKSRATLQQAKRATLEAFSLWIEQAVRTASNRYLKELMATQDALEGLNAFLEKRTPVWKHK